MGNIAYQLYLADIDTVNGTFVSPITNRVTQLAKVLESGGLNNWSVSGALDIAKEVSLGLTLTYVSGTYRYDRTYEEQDRARIYQSYPYDFDRYTLEEFVDGDISGFNAKFGLMYRVPDRFRLGVTVKTPTAFTVKENFGSYARAYFDNGDIKPDDRPFEDLASGDYGVRTPWVFTAGASVMFGDLVLSGDVEYTDWTEMEFNDATSDVMAQNRDFKTLFRPTANLRGQRGISVPGRAAPPRRVHDQPFPVRGRSEHVRPEVHHGRPRHSARRDRRCWTSPTPAAGGRRFRTNYNSSSRVNESITTNTILATFSHRF